MNAVNEATRMTLEKFKLKLKTAEEAKEQTLFEALREKRDEVCRDQGREPAWYPDLKEQAEEALKVWAAVEMGGLGSAVLDEIRQAGEVLQQQEEHSELGEEVVKSGGFLSFVMAMWFSEVDFEYIGQQLYAHFVEAAEAEANAPEPAAPPDAEAEAKAKCQQIIDDLMARYRPSQN